VNFLLFHWLSRTTYGICLKGFGLGIKMGATKAHFDDLIGIHPTTAEVRTLRIVCPHSTSHLQQDNNGLKVVQRLQIGRKNGLTKKIESQLEHSSVVNLR